MNRAPMTLDELSTETGMSKTRMSQVVREMVDYNIANKVYEKGIRKDLYAVEEDFYQIFISLFTSSWQKVIHKNKRMGRKVYHELLELSQTDNLDDKTKQKLDELLSETKKWLDYHDWLDRFVDFLDNGKVFKYVPKT